MAFVIADRVQETGTVSTGTGTVNLAGAVLGYQSFVSGIGSTNTTYYCIYDPAAYTWEVGLGTVTAGTPNTLARTTVYANSAGTQPSKISFSTTDTLTVFVTQPAETAIYTGASATLNSLSTTASTTGSTNMGPFNYGTLNYSDTGIVASYQTSVNSYFQMVLQNTNNGTSASTDYIVSSNNGTSTTNYGDFGINSSSFSAGTGALNQPSTVYLYSQSTDLAIGTNSSNALHFVVNGAVNATDAMTINAASSVAFNGQYGSMGQQLVSQGSSTPPIWANAGGTVTVTDFTATSGQTTFSVSYVIGTVSVYRNGIRLGQSDFTATNGTTVVLNTGAVAGDLIEIQSFTTLNIYTNITSQDFSGTGSQTVFTMNSAPGSSAALLVTISGVVQDPANYTVSGTTLTFSTAPAAGTNNISVRYLGQQSTTNVASFSGGTTGLSPTSAATGAVTLSGILVPANGGTGVNIATSDLTVHGLTVGLGGGSGTGNSAFGVSALTSNTASNNTAMGYQSLYTNTTGTSLVAVGYTALYSNTTGGQNTSVGTSSMYYNTTGGYNTATGYGALYVNSTGSYNTAFGDAALQNNTTASYNTAVGYQAGYLNTTGYSLTFIGAQSGYSNTTGVGNIGLGNAALFSNTTGRNNIAIGADDTSVVGALERSTTGSYNIAVGTGALGSNTTASNNTAVGYQAGYSNTTGTTLDAFGYLAAHSNTTGNSNSAIGYGTLYANTTGSYNVAVGPNALGGNTTANNNTAIGYQAAYANTTGYGLAAVGTSALFSNTTGGYNVGLGQNAGYSNTTGNYNLFLGPYSGYNTTGSQNTFVGNNSATQASGISVTSGSYNVILGNYSGLGAPISQTGSNYIVLSDGAGNPRAVWDSSGNFLTSGVVVAGSWGNGGFGTQYNGGGTFSVTGHGSGTSSGTAYAYFDYNNSPIGSISQTGTTAVLYNTTSDYRLKNNVTPIQNALAIVEALNPVSFTWVDGRKDDGFLAHELQAVIPNCVTGEKDAVNEDGTPKYQQMDNSGVIPFLVKAIQELNATVTDLQARLTKAGL